MCQTDIVACLKVLELQVAEVWEAHWRSLYGCPVVIVFCRHLLLPQL